MAYDREFGEGIELDDDALLDANDFSVKLHHQPWDYRRRQVRVEGRVYRAWYDPDVTRDQPYGVGRVMRVQLWNTVFGLTRPIILDGVETEINTPFLAVYEIAVLVDEEMALPDLVIVFMLLEDLFACKVTEPTKAILLLTRRWVFIANRKIFIFVF